LETLFDVDEDEAENIAPSEPKAPMPEVDDFTEEKYENYIASQVLLSKGDVFKMGCLMGRKRDQREDPIGRANHNPILAGYARL
jgi:hypothetical protein